MKKYLLLALLVVSAAAYAADGQFQTLKKTGTGLTAVFSGGNSVAMNQLIEQGVSTFSSVTANTYADSAETITLPTGRWEVHAIGTIRALSGATFAAADVVVGIALRTGSTFLGGQVGVDRLNGANQNTYWPFDVVVIVDVAPGSTTTVKQSTICSLTDSTTGAKATVWGSNSIISGVITTSNKFYAKRM